MRLLLLDEDDAVLQTVEVLLVDGVATFNLYDADNVLVETRPATTHEAAALTNSLRRDNSGTLTTQVGADISVLLASIEALKVIYNKTNATIGPADTKDVAREARRIARQVIALSRLVSKQVDTIDTGTQ